MTFDDPMSSMIGSLYEAAAIPELWPDTLQQFSDFIDGRFGHFLLWDEAQNRSVRSVIGCAQGAEPDPAEVALYDAHYGAIDPRRGVVTRTRPGEVVSCAAVISEEVVRTNEFYQDFLIPADVRWALMVCFPVSGSVHATFAGLRSPRMGAFEGNICARVQGLIPHFKRATRLAHQMSEASLGRELAADAWQLSADAMLITDEHARMRFINKAAKRLLCEAHGLRLRSGAIAARDPFAHRRLMMAIAAAVPAQRMTAAVSQNVALPRPSGRPLMVTVAPLPAPAMKDLGRSGALLLIADPDTSRPSVRQQLVDLFQLTRAEAELAGALADGTTLEELAERRSVRISTLRSQLSSVLFKTGSSRQVDLVRLIGFLPELRG